MRRWWLYIILYSLVGICGFSPFAGTDLAELSPVEVVWMEEQNGFITIETDGGESGSGGTVAEALENMRHTAAHTVFLDTADYLIVRKGDEGLILQIVDKLRPSCGVCLSNRKLPLEEVADFLHTHNLAVKLKNISEETEKLPLLGERKGRVMIVEE